MRTKSRRSFLLNLVSTLALVSCADVGMQKESTSSDSGNSKWPIWPSPKNANIDNPLIAQIHKRTFDWFWDITNHETGLTPDRWPTIDFSSVAGIGFALSSYCVAAEREYKPREILAERARNTLKYLYNLPQGPEPTGKGGYKGYFYHFLHFDNGTRYKEVELSSIDTSLLLLGAIFASEYFNRDNEVEREIREYTKLIYERVDWSYLQAENGLQSMGWHPEHGFIDGYWAGMNEGMMVYILGMASPTHPIPQAAYDKWLSTYDQQFEENWGQPHMSFHALFIHQYNHVYIDYRGIADKYMRNKGFDYFENSKRATLAQRNYATINPHKWNDYSAEIWGLTACDGPAQGKFKIDGIERDFRTYSARGPGKPYEFDDGTIAPTAGIASIPFTPDLSIKLAESFVAKYGDDIYTKYGFKDSFNPTFKIDGVSEKGKITKRAGWVSNDYLAIDQGPILLMIENHYSGLIWKYMRNSKIIKKGLQLADFKAMNPQGKWLEN